MRLKNPESVTMFLVGPHVARHQDIKPRAKVVGTIYDPIKDRPQQCYHRLVVEEGHAEAGIVPVGTPLGTEIRCTNNVGKGPNGWLCPRHASLLIPSTVKVDEDRLSIDAGVVALIDRLLISKEMMAQVMGFPSDTINLANIGAARRIWNKRNRAVGV